jgi:hypothetical protein
MMAATWSPYRSAASAHMPAIVVDPVDCADAAVVLGSMRSPPTFVIGAR